MKTKGIISYIKPAKTGNFEINIADTNGNKIKVICSQEVKDSFVKGELSPFYLMIGALEVFENKYGEYEIIGDDYISKNYQHLKWN